MRLCCIAMGNTLMGDDAVGIEVLKRLEETLKAEEIAFFYTETDFSYCITKLTSEDFIILLDSAKLGKRIGSISLFSLKGALSLKKSNSQHSFSILESILLYYPEIKGLVIAVEVEEIRFTYGLSNTVKEKLEELSEKILQLIREQKDVRKREQLANQAIPDGFLE